MCSDPSKRLAVYGSLAPGEVNQHHLADLAGRWQTGTVRGRLVQQGWGNDLGFPAMIPDPDGDEIEVRLFTSNELPAHWDRLDALEGADYRRVVTSVELPDGRQVQAHIYVANDGA